MLRCDAHINSVFLFCRKDLSSAYFICYRTGPVRSVMLRIEWDAVGDILGLEAAGWERNAHDELKPSVVDLSSTLDPLRYL